mmetsp:Transcript_56993/g.144513  ORF Transcript_56993/g.144513 Transcript_56993/m.144513 type:complete len:265 (-) Transcript_56993:268-1062(-)
MAALPEGATDGAVVRGGRGRACCDCCCSCCCPWPCTGFGAGIVRPRRLGEPMKEEEEGGVRAAPLPLPPPRPMVVGRGEEAPRQRTDEGPVRSSTMTSRWSCTFRRIQRRTARCVRPTCRSSPPRSTRISPRARCRALPSERLLPVAVGGGPAAADVPGVGGGAATRFPPSPVAAVATSARTGPSSSESSRSAGHSPSSSHPSQQQAAAEAPPRPRTTSASEKKYSPQSINTTHNNQEIEYSKRASIANKLAIPQQRRSLICNM